MDFSSFGDNSVPVLADGQPLTPEHIKKLNDIIKSDGCTGVADFFRDCCVVHDLGYRYGIDAYGNAVTRSQIDRNFRECMMKRSRFGRFSPMAWWRWAGVRIFGRRAFNAPASGSCWT